MLELAVLIKSLEFYSQQAHHVCARAVFNQDHAFLGEIYTKMNGDYDSVIERFIGLNGDAALDEQSVFSQAVQKSAQSPVKGVQENKVFFVNCLKAIKEINAKIEVLCKVPGTTQGTIQMLGNCADLNEVLIYKLQQRCK